MASDGLFSDRVECSRPTNPSAVFHRNHQIRFRSINVRYLKEMFDGFCVFFFWIWLLFFMDFSRYLNISEMFDFLGEMIEVFLRLRSLLYSLFFLYFRLILNNIVRCQRN